MLIANQVSLRVSRLSCEYVFSSDANEPRKLVLLSAIKASFSLLEDLTLPSDDCFFSSLEEFGPRMGKLTRLRMISTTSVSDAQLMTLLRVVAQMKALTELILQFGKGHLTIRDSAAVIKLLPFGRLHEFVLPALDLQEKLNFPNLKKIHVSLPSWAAGMLYESSLRRRNLDETTLAERLKALAQYLPYASLVIAIAPSIHNFLQDTSSSVGYHVHSRLFAPW